ncbi:MAG TPA: PD-(D/E)XK nuclease family protein [Gemmatimonadaceae bacterium]|nr:PD-(D/E)XK nuclease family protein [Gemmatimonadaceae bacterium]
MANNFLSPLLNALDAPALHDAGDALLVGPSRFWGRDLLRAHALRAGGWMGWRVATMKGVADLLAERPLARSGIRVASAVEVGMLIDEAFRLQVARGSLGVAFERLGMNAGFHRAVRQSVLELRTAGVEPDHLLEQGDSTEIASLAHVLDAYATLLRSRSLADHGAVMRMALDAFDSEAPRVLPPVIALAPGWTAHGLRRKLLQRLFTAGARPLVTVHLPADDVARDGDGTAVGGPSRPAPADSIEALAADAGREAWHVEPLPDGMPGSALAWLAAPAARAHTRTDDGQPDIALFHADSPLHELREVVRRALESGTPLDQVEVVATDPDLYASALGMLCRQLDIGATMVNGLPLPATRVGRALAHWFAWLESFLDASVLRSALESGDLVPVEADVPVSDIVRELRDQQIGWGLARYHEAIARLRDDATLRVRYGDADGDDMDDEERTRRAERRRRARRALAALLESIVTVLPPSIGEDLDSGPDVSAAAMAEATLAFVERVPADVAEQRIVEELRGRLEELTRQDEMPCGAAAAIAAVRDVVADVRAWPVARDGHRHTAAPGQLHLTSLSHAGASGRSSVFVVGLDVDHTGGPRQPDTLLPDALRERLGASRLPTTAGRRDALAWELATALGRLRGDVTLSWANAPVLGGRFSAPSATVLDAWRAISGDAHADYASLRAVVGAPACAIPGPESLAADARDVWLVSHAHDGVLIDGESTVADTFDGLRRGLLGNLEREGTSLGAWHGVVPDAARFDPRVSGRAVSPSALEALGTCPLRWFYRYVLGLRPPDDLQRDPGAWLDAATRGSLLHDLYAWAVTYAAGNAGMDADVIRTAVMDRLSELIDEAKRDIPSPGASVVAAERDALVRDVQLFLDQELPLRDGESLVGCEVAFGGSDGAVVLELPDDSRLELRGRIDRVDRLDDGTLRVVDYKTGRSKRFEPAPKLGPLHGGRMLQMPLYAAAASQRYGARVSDARYRFPTHRADADSIAIPEHEFAQAGVVVESLLAHVKHGEFIPTNDSDDCKFCDFAAICRAATDKYYKCASPRAEWARRNSEELDQYAGMRRRRGKDES